MARHQHQRQERRQRFGEVVPLNVADGANQRLVQFDKNGRFQRQIKPATQQAKAFNGLVSLYVDELKSKIYLLNGTGAYMANLPK